MDQTFASQLKRAMHTLGYRQADLIRLAKDRGYKLGKSQLSQYMSGKTIPRKDVCAMLEHLLNTTFLPCASSVGDAESELSRNTSFVQKGAKTQSAHAASEGNDTLTQRTSTSRASMSSAPVQPTPAQGVMVQHAMTQHGCTDISQSDGTSNANSVPKRMFNKSSKLNNVLYDVRGPVVDEAMRMEQNGVHVLKLNIGNPAPFGFRAPDEVVYDMQQQLVDCEGYSDSRGLFSARKAIMQYDQIKGIPNVHMEDIYTGNGVSELINLCMQALLDTGDEILIPSPDYPLWTACATLAGGTPVHYICDEQAYWYPDIADIRSKVTTRTKAIVIINPNNPTGSLYSDEILEEIVQIAREFNLIIFADEIYDRLVMDGRKHTSIASLAPDVFCVTFSGLSKSHMIAGFRIGWMSLSGDKSRARDYIMGINMLSNMRLCSNVPAQSIVQTALGGYQSVENYLVPKGRVYESREYCYQALQAMEGVSVVKPDAAFYMFVRLAPERFHIKDDEQFALDLLREKKVLIVHGKGFNWNTPGYFRIVYLPRLQTLHEAMGKIDDFLKYYRQ